MLAVETVDPVAHERRIDQRRIDLDDRVAAVARKIRRKMQDGAGLDAQAGARRGRRRRCGGRRDGLACSGLAGQKALESIASAHALRPQMERRRSSISPLTAIHRRDRPVIGGAAEAGALHLVERLLGERGIGDRRGLEHGVFQHMLLHSRRISVSICCCGRSVGS